MALSSPAPTRRVAALSFAGAGFARSQRRITALPPTPPQPDPSLWDPQGFPMRESWAEGPNGRIYVRTYGVDNGRPPVIVLHGGPAAGMRYLLSYALLAADRQVAFYDQSGCGRSDAPENLASYTVPRYVQELEAVRAHLHVERAVLLGHSWGGFLAPAYADVYPQHVSALVLAGSAARFKDFELAERRWIRALGPDAVAVAESVTRTGKTNTPAVEALQKRYYSLHNCRLNPPPAWLVEHGKALGQNAVYKHLNGPSEFQFNGTLSGLDMRVQLRRLRVPVLVTCGRYDEAPPWIARRLVAAVGSSTRLQIFDNLSHESHVEDPLLVTTSTRTFLQGLG